MSDCTSCKLALLLYVSDDLDLSSREKVETHLRGCADCMAELADIAQFSASVRAALEVRETLPLGVVTRISARAAEETVQAPWWRRLAFPVPVHGWSAAVPALLLAMVVAAPFVLNTGNVPPREAQGPVRLDMQLEGDGLRVAWSNGHNRTYKVFKTTNPRLLGTGTAQVVKGHEWVDRDAESPAIVYYRVE
jgi:hypothetical protein